MTPSEARKVLEMMTQFMGRAFSDTQLKAFEVAIAALEQHDGQSLLEKVRKYLDETPREQVLADWDATNQIKGGITVDEYLASLQPAPVYHYLPEVPEEKTWVFSFNTQDKEGRESYFVNGQFTDGCGGYLPTPYAWTRIPPKPPIKPTED